MSASERYGSRVPSEREQRVIELVAEGLKNREVALAIGTTEHVVKNYLRVIYDKLGRHADAEAERAKLKAAQGDASAYQYATIYAQWGDRAKALEWLETAWRLRDGGLLYLKTDPLLDPLRQEPRFKATERELKFPS